VCECYRDAGLLASIDPDAGNGFAEALPDGHALTATGLV
jgi:hypothetical protein